MHRPNNRWTLWSFDDHKRHPGAPPLTTRTDFYREEFLKFRESLEAQREAYSDHAVDAFECALNRILGELERVSSQDDADRLVSELLRHFNLVTGLSAWCDQTTLH